MNEVLLLKSVLWGTYPGRRLSSGEICFSLWKLGSVLSTGVVADIYLHRYFCGSVSLSICCTKQRTASDGTVMHDTHWRCSLVCIIDTSMCGVCKWCFSLKINRKLYAVLSLARAHRDMLTSCVTPGVSQLEKHKFETNNQVIVELWMFHQLY